MILLVVVLVVVLLIEGFSIAYSAQCARAVRHWEVAPTSACQRLVRCVVLLILVHFA